MPLKHRTPIDTLFEILHHLGDQLSENIEDENKWNDVLRIFRNTRYDNFYLPENQRRIKLTSFMDYALCPNIKSISKKFERTVISFQQFEKIILWSSYIYKYLLDYLASNAGINILIFINNAKRPNFFYGSDEDAMSKIIHFHKLTD